MISTILRLSLLAMAIGMVGCKSIDTSLLVGGKTPEGEAITEKLLVKTDDGKLLRLSEGKYPLKLKFKKDEAIMDLETSGGKRKVVLKIKDVEDLMNSVESKLLLSDTIGQPFDVRITRTPDLKKDRFTIQFLNIDTAQVLASSYFAAKADGVKFDEDRKQFLESYQKVRYKHRGVYIRIDGATGGKVLNGMINYGGAALIAPWAYARYKYVRWDLSSSREAEERWLDLVGKAPVIDYISMVHSGHQYEDMVEVGKHLKKNQLRMVYSGACGGKANSRFITDYQAVASAGHRFTSASPIWQHKVLKRWVYGYNFKNVIKSSWVSGVRTVKALKWISFAPLWEKKYGVLGLYDSADDLIASSEMMLATTTEFPADKLYIDQSYVTSKEKFEKEELVIKRVTKMIEEDKANRSRNRSNRCRDDVCVGDRVLQVESKTMAQVSDLEEPNIFKLTTEDGESLVHVGASGLAKRDACHTVEDICTGEERYHAGTHSIVSLIAISNTNNLYIQGPEGILEAQLEELYASKGCVDLREKKYCVDQEVRIGRHAYNRAEGRIVALIDDGSKWSNKVLVRIDKVGEKNSSTKVGSYIKADAYDIVDSGLE